MQNYDLAYSYIAALTQCDPATVIVDFRALHDRDKTVAGIPRRGTLPQLWDELCQWNNAGYGIFANLNELDGNGRELSNVTRCRVQAIDLDNLSALQNYHNAAGWSPSPSFAVQSSPNKFHVYWRVVPYVGNERFTIIQRKLKQLFDGDRTIIDASRILRLPGTYHCKGEPSLVNVWALAGLQMAPLDPAAMEAALAHINVVDGHGGRRELGDASLAAPSLDWVKRALAEIDPNSCDRSEWIKITAAVKQAAWSLADEGDIFQIWSEWCAQYQKNDVGENSKQWNSIRNSEAGWPALEKLANTQGARLLGAPTPFNGPRINQDPLSIKAQETSNTPNVPGEFLTAEEQQALFKGCVFIERSGEILTPNGRFMNSNKFNGAYGGRYFIVNSDGKKTDEPWKAALRSTLWTIPKVDHIRFIPQREPGEFIKDALNRYGVNTYKPAIISSMAGDIRPFLYHMQLMFPVESDRNILFGYMAHNARFPGYKIPWAPLIQSTEGVGKKAIKHIIEHFMGSMYVYSPKAEELVNSGSKFNSWMRSKLFILVDEIKVDERRDMIEILKPMISESKIEIQAKGIDQDIEDNYSNWMFFSNYKDAIPVNKNSRRFSIFYSAIQSVEDLNRLGMDQSYFDQFWTWLEKQNGFEIIAHWILNYPIERGAIPMRAPETSSTPEALRQSRGPMDTAILEAIEDGLAGFRGGFVSVTAVLTKLKTKGGRAPSAKTVGAVLEGLGYTYLGRAPRAYFTEDPNDKAQLYGTSQTLDIQQFGRAQGYE